VALKYIDEKTCANQYPEEGRFDGAIMFCTGASGVGRKDACQVSHNSLQVLGMILAFCE
jgi:hypothetical protein